MRRTFWTDMLLISSFIACPCHLPLTLALLLSLFGGTALGVFFAAHTTWIVAFSLSVADGFALGQRLAAHCLNGPRSLVGECC